MDTRIKPRKQSRQELVNNIKADIQVWKEQVQDESLPAHVRENAQRQLDQVRHCSTKKIEARQNGRAETQEGSEA